MKTMSRVYDSYSQAEHAIADLARAGIPDSDISLIANKYVSEKYDHVESVEAASTGAGVGAAVGGGAGLGAGLLAGLGLLAIPGLGPVVAAGWLAATALSAVGGAVAGGLIGALVGAGVPEVDAHVYSEAIRRGGTMVTVRYNESNERTVMNALNKYTPIDAAARRIEYQKTGWQKFDPNAEVYRPNETEIERIRHRG